MTYKISDKGLSLIKEFESFVPFWYDDRKPVRGVKYGYREWNGGPVKGELTIGYGHTKDAKHPLKPEVGKKITEAEAIEILDVDLDECEEDVNRLVKVPLSQEQFDALVSFVFNCGTGAFKGSTLLKVLNRKQYNKVPTELSKWVNDNGEELAGLVRRRRAEADLWKSGKEPTEDLEPRATVVPDVPKDTVKDLVQSRAVQGAAASTTLGIAQTADQLNGAVEQMQSAQGYISNGTIFGLVIGVLVIGASCYALYAKWVDAGRPKLW